MAEAIFAAVDLVRGGATNQRFIAKLAELLTEARTA